MPQNIAAFQSSAQPPQVSAELPDYVTLPDLGDQALSELNPLGYYLGTSNDIEGSLTNLPPTEGQESYRVLPTLRNWTDDGVVRSDLVDNMLVVPESREAHAKAIVDLVVAEMYAGIDLDYRGINPDLSDEYTDFVQQLADELHANGKRLTVHVEAPTQVSEDRWETGAYDWVALGHAADGVKFPAIQDPAAYALGGQMEDLLWWAVGKVERYKLQPVFTARSVENAGGVLAERTYRDALAELSKVAVKEGNDCLVPGDQVTVSLETVGVQFDPATGRYWFSYVDEASGEERKVWLEDASSLSRKLDLLSRFNLGGVAVRALWDEGNDPRVWDLVREYQASAQAAVAPVDSSFSVVWSVEDTAGGQVSEQTTGMDQRDYTWTAPEQPGEYQIGVSIVANDGQTVAGAERVAFVVDEPTPTPTLTPTPTPIPTATPTPDTFSDAITHSDSHTQADGKACRHPLPPPIKSTSRAGQATHRPTPILAMASRPTWCTTARRAPSWTRPRTWALAGSSSRWNGSTLKQARAPTSGAPWTRSLARPTPRASRSCGAWSTP